MASGWGAPKYTIARQIFQVGNGIGGVSEKGQKGDSHWAGVFAGIPHTLFLTQEAYYHSLVYLLLKLLGFTIHAEPLTNLGRIDAVVELPSAVYIIEFKMPTAQIALDQIRAKQYDLPYRNGGKPIILLGIAFDATARNIADWQMAQSAQRCALST